MMPALLPQVLELVQSKRLVWFCFVFFSEVYLEASILFIHKYMAVQKTELRIY